MPPNQCCSKQLPLKKYRTAKHHVVTDSDKRSTNAPFSALNHDLGGLCEGRSGGKSVSRANSSSSEQTFSKLDVSVSISKPSDHSGVNGSGKKSKKVVDELAADKKPVKTDFSKMYYRELGVAKAPKATEKAEAKSCNLELLGQVSLEKLKSDVDKVVKSGMQKVLADRSKQEILPRGTSSSHIKLSDQLISMDSLPPLIIERLKSLSGMKSDDQSTGSFNSRFTSISLGRLLRETSGDLNTKVSESLSSLSGPLMKSDDQSAALIPTRNPSSDVSTLLRGLSDGSFQLMIGSNGSSFDAKSMRPTDQNAAWNPSRPARVPSDLSALVRGLSDGSSQLMVMTKSDDYSVTCKDLSLSPPGQSAWLRETSDGSSVPDGTAQEPNEVTSQGNSSGQALDVDAVSAILAIAERTKKIAEMVPSREDVSAIWKADDAEAESQERQNFEKTKKDVLFGRGTGPNAHNRFFREEVAKQREDYLAGHNAEQDTIVRGLFNFVQSKGGRFLKQDSSNKQWFEVKDKEVFSKIRQMIREYKTKEQREHTSAKAKKKKKATKPQTVLNVTAV